MLRFYHTNRLDRRRAATPHTNYSYAFRQWLGRDLAPFERRIIEPLESYRFRMYMNERYHRSRHPLHIARLQRQSQQPWRPMRIFVDDIGLHGDAIRRLLIRYTAWLHDNISTDLSTCIVHRSKKLAGEEIRGTPLHRSRRTILCSCKRAHSVRGQTFHRVLLLDTDLYGRATLRKYAHRYAMTGCEEWRPERTQAFRIVSGAVIAPLSTWYSSMLIIHGNPLTHPRMHYARLRRHALDHPDDSPYTVISPDTAETSCAVDACIDPTKSPPPAPLVHPPSQGHSVGARHASPENTHNISPISPICPISPIKTKNTEIIIPA